MHAYSNVGRTIAFYASRVSELNLLPPLFSRNKTSVSRAYERD